ncbi:hypothetical protein BT69DRAFT_1093335 [Atractiella rhizophila]|nr:hypothetical protein BT69DRAFT_1093335 [Atractiella rhizophila]
MDDLFDISFNSNSNATAPLKPTPSPGTLNTTTTVKKPNAFDLLFPTSPAAAPTPRNSSPSPSQPLSAAKSTAPSLPSTGTTNSGAKKDAFGDLFGNQGVAEKKENMSMADRLKATHMFPGSGSSSPKAAPSPKADTASDPWDFDLLTPSQATASKPTASPFDTPVASSSSRNSPLLDDFGDFSQAGPASTSAASGRSRTTQGKGPSLLGDFEDGSENDELDGNLLDDAAADDDILGELGKPVPKRNEWDGEGGGNIRLEPSPSVSPLPRTPPMRGSTPPPHILGELVLMGFSVPQAKNALLATVGPNGEWNLEAAVEAIVSSRRPSPAGRGESTSKTTTTREEREAEARKRVEDEWGDERVVDHDARRRRYLDDDDDPPPPPPQRRSPQVQPQSEESTSPTNNPFRPSIPKFLRANSGSSSPGGTATPKIPQALQDQASVLAAQASAFGMNVFSKANKLYQTSQATVKKALDERKLAQSSGQEGTAPSRRGGKEPANGRPKWMTDGAEEIQAESSVPVEKFSDFRDEEVLHQRPPARQASTSSTQPPQPSLLGDPFSDRPPVKPAERQPYVSSARRKVATRDNRAPTPSSSSNILQTSVPASRSVSPKPPTPAPARPRRPPRTQIDATPQQLSACSNYRSKGNEFFKLGRFGDAEQEYSKAIDSLPEKHLALLPLLNNRAASRLKTGDNSGTIKDCVTVLEIVLQRRVGEDSKLALLADEFEENLGESDAKDCVGKALSRRAKAYEATEKWQKALDDWLLILKSGDAINRSAGGTKVVSEGVSRCRQIVEGPSRKPTRPAATRPVTVPIVKVDMNSEKVQQLREASNAAEAEAAERLRLKDSVDGRIQAWKGGKETNLRALIASLDNVLWKELEWKTVGMHELVTDKQVKIRYMKAIAKLHPDKLDASTTTEQRMIANGAFNGLNEAWNASKP